jgi:lysozyme
MESLEMLHWKEAVIEQLKQDEGFVSHVYADHLGFLTIGYGFLVDERRNGGLTVEECEYILKSRVERIEKQLESRISFWRTLPDNVKLALVNMAYQLGVNGVMRFKNMMGSLSKRNWKDASDHALDSNWAKQTPKRAIRVANLIKNAYL